MDLRATRFLDRLVPAFAGALVCALALAHPGMASSAPSGASAAKRPAACPARAIAPPPGCRLQSARQLRQSLGHELRSHPGRYHGAQVPLRLNGRVAFPGGGWQMLGVPGVKRRSHSQGAVWSTRKFDVLQEYRQGRLKESIVVKRRMGLHTWRWRLTVPAGVKPRVDGRGRVHLARGTVIAPPILTSGSGTVLRAKARWRLRGTLLELRIDDRRLKLPYVIDPTSDYPQVLYLSGDGVSQVNGAERLVAGAEANSTAGVSEVEVDANGNSKIVWSGYNYLQNPYDTPIAPVNGAPYGTDSGGPKPGAAGWLRPFGGGTTLPANAVGAGTWRVSAEICPSPSAPSAKGGLRARVLKVKVDGSGNIVRWRQMAPWSPTGDLMDSWNVCRIGTTTVTPTDRSLAPDEYLYLELAVNVTTSGAAGTVVTIKHGSANTFIDFGTGSYPNTAPPATTLTITPTPNAADVVTDNTPTFAASLLDLDSYQHAEFQLCSDSGCASAPYSGSSTAGQTWGSTTNSWTPTTAIPDGVYWARARLVEDPTAEQTLNSPAAWTTPRRLIIDTTPPAPPAPVNDGTSTDQDFTSSLSSLSANWAAASDLSGISRYDVCFTTSSTGADCAGTAISPWQSNSTSTSVTRSGLSLVEDGTRYYACVRAVDGAGFVSSTITCSDGATIDTSAPSQPGPVADSLGTDIDASASSSTVSANWAASTDANGILRYEYCISTAVGSSGCSGTMVVPPWTSVGDVLNFTRTGLTLSNGSMYFVCVRAIDNAGGASPHACSDGFLVDLVNPPDPTPVTDGSDVTDDSLTSSSSQLAANWPTVTDPTPGSGLDRYEACFSTSATGSDCAGTATSPWGSTGTTTSVLRTGLTLTHAQTYYACVRAVDKVDRRSGIVCSNGVVVDLQAPAGDHRSFSPASTAWTFWAGPNFGNELMWFNPDATASTSIDVVVQSTDPSGIARVVFPSLTGYAGWSGTGGADTTPETVGADANLYRASYSFVGPSAGAPLVQNAVAWDRAGNQTLIPFELRPDSVDPVTGTIGGAAGLQSTSTYTYPVTATTDAGSGLGGWLVQYDLSTLSDDACTGFSGTWKDGDSGTGMIGSISINLPFSGCIKVRFVQKDNVSNDATSNESPVRRIDLVNPTVDLTSPATGTLQRATFDVLGTAKDAESGIGSVVVRYSGPATGDACNPATLTQVDADDWNWTCSWNTSALADGVYTVTVTSYDRSGRASSTDSITVTLDNKPPPAPSPVNDGLDGEADWSSSASTHSANWAEVVDVGPSGRDRYEWCITVDSTGSDCALAAVQPWTSNGRFTTAATRTGLSLVEGTTYYSCVVVYDRAGNRSPIACSDGVTVDTTRPPASTEVRDGLGADLTWLTSASTASLNWDGVVDPVGGGVASGLDHYEYCLSTDATGADCAVGDGLRLACYDNMDFTGASVTRIDPVVDFPWDDKSCDPSIGVDTFSARWTGSVQTTTGGTYTFSTISDDGVRLWVNGVLVIDNWTNHSQKEDSGTITLSAETFYDIRLEYYENGGNSRIKLAWTPPAGSKQTIPQSQLWSSPPATGPIRRWTSAGLATSVTRSGLSLSEGWKIYGFVRAVDAAGNIGPVTRSDAQTVDTVQPPATAALRDGTGATDDDYSSAPDELSANWDAVTDPAPGSGVQRYEYCFTLSATGTDCAGAATAPWTSSGTSTTVTRGGLTLVHDTVYYACVRAIDVATNVGTNACSDGVRTDLMPPPAPAPVNDGTAADVDWLTSTTSISGNWATVTDPSGISRYEYCVTTDSTGADCASGAVVAWTDNALLTSFTRALILTEGLTYYVCARSFDGAPSASPRACSDGATLDATPPPATADVRDGTAADLVWSRSGTSLSLNWDAVSDPLGGGVSSGLDRYEYCLSTSSSGADCAGGAIQQWLTSGTTAAATRTGLTLAEGTKVYGFVRSFDRAGNESTTVASDAQTVDTVAPGTSTGVRDGLAADRVFWSTDGELSANWDGVLDPTPGSGVERYELCFSTSAGGADCAAGATAPWTSTGLALNGTFTGLTLAHDTLYYACVRAFDVAGNDGGVRCSNGVRTDFLPPVPPEPVNDGTGADLDWVTSSTTFSGNWATVTDPSGISRYTYCITTAFNGSDCALGATVTWVDNGLSTSMTHTGLMLVEGTPYYTCAEAWDNAPNPSGIACSDGATLDLTAPPAPAAVRDGTAADLAWSRSGSSLSLNWDAVTDPVSGSVASGVDRYEYCLSTDPAGADCSAGAVQPWLSVGTTTSATRSGLTLAEGTTVYGFARAWDRAGNTGPRAASDGQTVDSVTPPASPEVRDGTGADRAWWTSTSTLSANWDGVTDPAPASGVADYEYCFSTSATGADCAAGAVTAWSSAGLALDATSTGLTLVHDTRYYACVRAVDTAGNTGPQTCSNGMLADFLPPPAPAPVNDGLGADEDWLTSTTTLSANWATVTDPSGISRYDYCISTSATGSDCALGATVMWTDNALATSVTATGLMLIEGTTYFVCAKAWDNGPNESAVACSDGTTVDSVPPPASAAVRDGTAADAAWTTSPTELSANWDAVLDPAPASGIARYDTCFSTTATGTDCAGTATAPWASAGDVTSVTRSSLALAEGAVYFACVRAVDLAGNVGASACSDGITVDSVDPPAPAATRDGAGSDEDLGSSSSSLTANWASVVDPAPASGLDRYEYCFSTSSTGADCGSTATVAWSSAGTALTATSTGLPLVHDTTYFACARAVDVAGNVGAPACSDGILTDFLPPAAPSWTHDGTGTDVDFIASWTELSGNWDAVTDPNGILRYEYCFTESATGADCDTTATVSWTSSGAARGITATGLTLGVPVTYYSCARAVDGAGNLGYVTCSDGQTTDTGPPPAPASVDDGTGADIDYTRSTDTLAAHWAAVTDMSGISRYEYCFSTSATGADCAGSATLPWTSSAGATSVSITPLPLVSGATYYTCVRAVDGVLNTGAERCSDGQSVDITGPTGITAVTPADASSPDEGWITLDWTAGSDAGSGVARYDVWVDGKQRAVGIAADSSGPYAFYPGAHSWRIRAYDRLGNFSDFSFTFTAVDVPDVTPPDSFDLLTPADGADLKSGSSVTWEAAYDWEGIANYRIFIDGALAGTVPGTETSFIPGTGAGTPLCSVTFDPATSAAGCVDSPTFAPEWTIGAHGGWNSGGNSVGFDSFDGDRVQTRMIYNAPVPTGGADFTFEHHYDNHASYNADGSLNSGFDGGQVQVSTDGGATWLSTCGVGAKAIYGTTISCDEEIVEVEGGYTAVLGSSTGNPLKYHHVFAGDSRGMVQTRVRLSKWAGQNVLLRFVQSQDSCYVGMPAADAKFCPANIEASQWQVDNVSASTPPLQPGLHTWYVEAVDPSGNKRQSAQTWTFNLTS